MASCANALVPLLIVVQMARSGPLRKARRRSYYAAVERAWASDGHRTLHGVARGTLHGCRLGPDLVSAPKEGKPKRARA